MTFKRRHLGLAFLLAACGSSDLDIGECGKDTDCAPGLACMARTCVAFAAPTEIAYAFDLTPTKESSSEIAPAYTELTTPLAGAGDGFVLERRTRLVGSVDASKLGFGTARRLDGMRVVAAVASVIDPARNVTFESETRTPAGAEGDPSATFSMLVPASAVARAATVWCRPASGADEMVPPWVERRDPLGPTLTLFAPGADEMILFEGKLNDAFVMPAVAYRARALFGGRVVSNEGMTTTYGNFRVLVPKASLPSPAPPLTIEFVPIDATMPLPRLTLPEVVVGDARLATLKLPPFARAETFRFPVKGGPKPIAGATLRLRTTVPGALVGEASLQRDGQTNAEGIAEVALIPGTSEAALSYSIVVIPPASSLYEARCVSDYPVVGSGSTAPRTVAAIELVPKATLTGRLVDAAGNSANGVSVTATLVKALPSGCTEDITAPPATVVTDAKGQFVLPLARGTYAFEYTPGTGSALPLHQEMGVEITTDVVTRTVTLPAAQLVSGVVIDADRRPTSGVDVRVFRPIDAMNPTPKLLGRALSGSDGAFRLVIPTAP